VRPFTRELSIRPLTFRLLQQQGVQISDYRKDGEKYFFNPEREELSGAHLKYVCFVEVSGESETTISLLNEEQFLQTILKEKKHFTFMERESAEVYADILSKKIPVPFLASVGTDLDKQGKAFNSVFLGHAPHPAEEDISSNNYNGRNHKQELIRTAWSKPEEAPLAEIIPLLEDFDLKILKLAFSFFQTYPVGKVESIEPPSSKEKIPPQFKAGWLRGADWLDGCNKLVEQSRPEVFGKFAYPWIKSAPFIYPFLSYLTSSIPEKYKHVISAWTRYKDESVRAAKDPMSANLHLLYYQDEGIAQEKLLETLAPIESNQRIIVVPIIANESDSLAPSIELIRLACENGLKLELSRYIPLCSIDETQANFLLNAGAFETSAFQGQIDARLFSNPDNSGKTSVLCSSIKDIGRIDDNILWLEKPYAACLTCGFYPLGLCRGGFFKSGPTMD